MQGDKAHIALLLQKNTGWCLPSPMPGYTVILQSSLADLGSSQNFMRRGDIQNTAERWVGLRKWRKESLAEWPENEPREGGKKPHRDEAWVRILRKARDPWVPWVSLQIQSGIEYESYLKLCQGDWERTGSSVGGGRPAGRCSKPRQKRGHCHCAAEKDRGQLQTWWRAGCRLRNPGKLRAAGSCQQLEISEVSWPEGWIKCVSMAQYEIAKFHPRLGMHQHPQHHDRQHSHRVTGSRLVGMDLRLTHWHRCHWVSVSCWRLRTGWWEASPPALQATMKWGGIFLTWSFPESGVAFCSPGGPRAESWPW